MSYGSYGDGGFYFLQPVDAEYGGVHYGQSRLEAGIGLKPQSRPGLPGTTKEIRVITSGGLEVGKKRNTYKLYSAPTEAGLDAYIGNAFSVGDASPIATLVITQFEQAMAAKISSGGEVLVVEEPESLLQRYRLPLLAAGGLGVAYLLYRRFM